MILDIHSHILPGMDDGCQHCDESIAVLQMMKKQGVELVCATPHFYCWNEDLDSFLSRRHFCWRRLQEELAKIDSETVPQIYLGAEVAYADALAEIKDFDRLCYMDPLTGKKTKAVLIEMPFRQWSSMEVEFISDLALQKGYEVIIAHIERFIPFQKNTHHLDTLLTLPVHIQMNAETLIPFFGRRQWLSMFEEGLIDFIASDAHNQTVRRPRLDEARKILSSKFGSEMLDEMDRREFETINKN